MPTPAQLSMKDQATKHTTVKWSVFVVRIKAQSLRNFIRLRALYELITGIQPEHVVFPGLLFLAICKRQDENLRIFFII